jgi:acetyl-CoA carboxylase beta subunit
MSPLKALGKILLCVFLEVAVLSGARMTQEEIERLMQMGDTQVMFVVRKGDKDDPPAP